MGDVYRINILVRNFLEHEIFKVNDYLKADNQYIALEEYPETIKDPKKANPENRSFLEMILRSAQNKGTPIMPLKSESYCPRRIKRAVPDQSKPELVDAAAKFFERIIQASRVFPRLSSSQYTTIILKPEAHNVFYRMLLEHQKAEKKENKNAAEYSYILDNDHPRSKVDIYADGLFDFHECNMQSRSWPSEFMGFSIEPDDCLSMMEVFWRGLEETIKVKSEDDEAKRDGLLIKLR